MSVSMATPSQSLISLMLRPFIVCTDCFDTYLAVISWRWYWRRHAHGSESVRNVRTCVAGETVCCGDSSWIEERKTNAVNALLSLVIFVSLWILRSRRVCLVVSGMKASCHQDLNQDETRYKLPSRQWRKAGQENLSLSRSEVFSLTHTSPLYRYLSHSHVLFMSKLFIFNTIIVSAFNSRLCAMWEVQGCNGCQISSEKVLSEAVQVDYFCVKLHPVHFKPIWSMSEEKASNM